MIDPPSKLPASWSVSVSVSPGIVSSSRWETPAPMLGFPYETRRNVVNGYCYPCDSGSGESWFEPRRGNWCKILVL